LILTACGLRAQSSGLSVDFDHLVFRPRIHRLSSLRHLPSPNGFLQLKFIFLSLKFFLFTLPLSGLVGSQFCIKTAGTQKIYKIPVDLVTGDKSHLNTLQFLQGKDEEWDLCFHDCGLSFHH
jgi:hypothetical protein